MRRTALLSSAALLLACSLGFGQAPDGFVVSQLPGDKKAEPLKKPPVKVDTPPQIVSGEPTPTGSRLETGYQVARAPEFLGDVAPAGRFMFATITPFTLVPQQPPAVGLPPPPPLLVLGKPVDVPAGILPGLRSLKVADNGSPRPQDRIYFGFNVYDNLYDPQNRAVGSTAYNIRLYRETVGFEKTFFDRRVSVGLRLPLNTLSVDSPFAGVGGTHTAIGDLSIIMQGAVLRNEEADNYFTLGLAITPPTGPSTIANISANPGPHTTTLQPFLAGLVNFGDVFLQGFTAIDFATGSNDVVLWYNDICLGVFVLRAEERQFITAIAPAFEVHSSIALNASDNFGAANPLAFADVVDFGFVGNMEFLGRSRLSVGVVFPVTTPRPFDAELIAQFRFIF